MGKKKQKIEPDGKFKTSEDRRREVDRLKTEFDDHFGVLIDSMPERDVIFRDMDTFVSDGASKTFEVKLKGTQRVAHVQLCNRSINTSSIRLSFRDHI